MINSAFKIFFDLLKGNCYFLPVSLFWVFLGLNLGPEWVGIWQNLAQNIDAVRHELAANGPINGNELAVIET